ncbi:hypothetical protein HDU91_006440 [Kappamyces sp. JEL0680]|nr:hypothetical protein HDU91_006440 [Kappamyces sp. JEL0680]
MESLLLLSETVSRLESHEKVIKFALGSNALYSVSLGNGLLLVRCQAEAGQPQDTITIPTTLDEGAPPGGVVAFFYQSEGDSLVLGLSSGEIITISCSQWIEEPVGVVDMGMLAMAPAPDGELLVIVTGSIQNGPVNLILMTKDFDIVSEIPLFDQKDSKGTGTAP